MFDPSAANDRLARLWKLQGNFGLERGTNRVFLDEIVSDRIQFFSGLQVLRDELQLAPFPNAGDEDHEACAAEFSQPSVLSTLAVTNCGDRVHQGELAHYTQVVASRFAAMSEIGELKPEAFRPTGGGTDDAGTLAYVTWAHAVDGPLQRRLYDGNAKSFVLCGFDLKTHVGRSDDGTLVYGMTRESRWREPRAACGAIGGALQAFDEKNEVFRRIRRDLGEENFALLSSKGVRTAEGIDITMVVGAAIVAIRGLISTARAMASTMDERGVAHLTASMTVNRPSRPDTMIYLARATVFHGAIRTQGFGTDAAAYGASMVTHKGDPRLKMTYGGKDGPALEATSERYEARVS